MLSTTSRSRTAFHPHRLFAVLGSLLGALFVLALGVGVASAQDGAEGGEWRHYAGDRGSTKYSPLDQIDASNVGRLVEAWRWDSVDTDVDTPHRPGHFKNTPLMIGGVLYVSTTLSQVAAIDAGTGETVWVYDPKSYQAGRPANAGFQHRGLEYWTDGAEQRLIYTAQNRRLISIDLETGLPDVEFGDEGMVDTSVIDGEQTRLSVMTHSAPVTVCADVVVVGSIISDGPTGPEMPPGHVRGYDVRTGELKWTFHTIPRPGELGHETWLDGSWEYTGNTNVWSMTSCDEELGWIYLPLSTPTNDWYGGHRPGDGLFAESLVALDARTGERKWHFQAVHHGVWDYDFPCAPNLVDVTVDGRKIEAVAQVSKQGFTYVFDRVTGEPVWPIVERPVPQSSVPGERTSPTQPHPTRPPPFERQGVTEDDLIDFTPELRAEARAIFQQYVAGPLFTPPIVVGEGGKKGTLMLPSAAGGANWRGAAIDPEDGSLYVPSMTLVMVNGLREADPARSEFRYVYGADFLVPGPRGLPLIKPPYGRVTKIDLNRGEIVWQVADGPGPKDHPELAGLSLGDLGSAAHGVLSNGGLVLTRSLLFVIQAEVDESNMMRMGKTGYLRAFDKETGAKVFERVVEPTPHGSPMTYLHEGRQYLVVAVGGIDQPAQLVAFELAS
ncbi:MAG TPA: pyrroloquinoline quinone-dependent dehydrogenase [Thermoanaerobaculia bacterium]|nr:pyrroloquinoline quinone-dependent dehydrogenase [Thermoanaerobaculia bacterium]